MATDRHKYKPIRFRPPEADRLRLQERAQTTGRAVNAILAEALALYLGPVDGPTTTPVPPAPAPRGPTTGPTTRKRPQAAPRSRSAPKAASPVAAIVAEPEQTDTPVRGCKHARMRVRKGVCPDCKEWVSPNS